MIVPHAGTMLPALLDALGYVGTGVTVLAERGRGLERMYINGPAASLFGYTVEEIRARPVIEQIAPEQREMVLQLSAAFRAGQPVPPALECIVVRKDGSTTPIEFAIGSFRIPDGIAYVLVLRNVSVYQQTTLSLLEADRIGLVGALAAGFAHEINNALTPVGMNLRLLRTRFTAGLPFSIQHSARRCIDDISTSAERIANNVRALQTLTTRSETVAIDLAGVVSSALRLAGPSLETRAQVIRQIFPVRKVLGEEARIGQAVIAMLLFSSSGFDTAIANQSNRIVVAVEQRDEYVVLEVSDNGCALTAEETLRAFDPFYRSATRGSGVGVGLGVARSVAATLGGEVTLSPRPEGGAVITMRLRAMS